MINFNEIAFIDTDGFDYNDGECLVRFDTIMYCPDKKLITFAVTKQGRISDDNSALSRVLVDRQC